MKTKPKYPYKVEVISTEGYGYIKDMTVDERRKIYHCIGEQYKEIEEWINENVNSEWGQLSGGFYFKNADDALMCKIIFGGPVI